MKRAIIIGKEKTSKELTAILPLVDYQAIAKTDNGVEALRMVQRVEPDLILCAWNISGFSALDLVQNLIHAALCPVVLILDEKEYEHLELAVRTGVHHILMAPLRAAEVAAAIIQAEYRFKKSVEDAKNLSRLNEELLTRKYIYRALLSLIAGGMSEEEAYAAIRTEAMAARKTMRTVAREVIDGKFRP